MKVSFNRAICERPKEWPKEWIDVFTDFYTNQGYGLSNNLKGLEGVMKVIEARIKIEREVYDSLKLAKYKIDNTSFNIEFLKQKINSIIEVNL